MDALSGTAAARAAWGKRLQKLSRAQLLAIAKKLSVTFAGDEANPRKGVLVLELQTRLDQGLLKWDDVLGALESPEVVAASTSSRAPSTRDLLAEIENLKSTLARLEERLDDLRASQVTHARQSRESMESLAARVRDQGSVGSTQSLLRTIRDETMGIQVTPENLDDLISRLEGKGISRHVIARDVVAAAALLDVTIAYKTAKWTLDLGQFYEDLRRLASSVEHRGDEVVIPELREAVARSTNTSREDFDSLVLELFKRGWVTLHLGSPLVEPKGPHLESDGARYYYLRFERDA